MNPGPVLLLAIACGFLGGIVGQWFSSPSPQAWPSRALALLPADTPCPTGWVPIDTAAGRIFVGAGLDAESTGKLNLGQRVDPATGAPGVIPPDAVDPSLFPRSRGSPAYALRLCARRSG